VDLCTLRGVPLTAAARQFVSFVKDSLGANV
jgi:hypothetical protein